MQPDPMNKEGVLGAIAAFRGAFPDLTHTINAQWSDGDHVFTLLTVKGTMENEMMGIPASGITFLP